MFPSPHTFKDERPARRDWIVGCGDVGRRILRMTRGRDGAFHALVRRRSSVEACVKLKAVAVAADLDRADCMTYKSVAGRVIWLAPPPREGVRDPRIRRFLDLAGGRIERLVLIGTTGVYGDHAGRWIDEQTPPAPRTERAKRRLDAERAVAAWSARGGGTYLILRVPGIYAEDRLPVERLREGLPVAREEESPYTNRIHADDLAAICVAALECRASNLVLNATDGHPTRMTTYFNKVADALGIARPPQAPLEEVRAAATPGMLSYLNESRRIDNRLLMRTLGVSLRYPSLDATLSKVHAR